MADNYCKCCGDGTPEYIIELNQQGAPGKRGEKGEQGYSPVVDFIADNDEIRFSSTNENNVTYTPNLYDYLAKKDLSNVDNLYDLVAKRDLSNIPNPVTINDIVIDNFDSGQVRLSSDKAILFENKVICLGSNGTYFIVNRDLNNIYLKTVNGGKATYNGNELATVNNISDSKVTINQGDVVKGSFTLNQSGDTTIELDTGVTNPLKIEGATEDNPSGGTVTYSMELGLDSSNKVYLNRNSKFVQSGSISEVSENIVKDNQIYVPIYKTARIVDNDVNRRLTIGYDTDSKLYIRNYLTNSGNTYKSMAPITSDIINYPIYLEEVTGTPGLEGAYTIKLNYDNNTLKLNESNQLYTDFTGVNNSISELTTLVDAKNDNIFDIGKFTIVGSPTITNDGVASGFSNGNYLITTSNINFSTASSWEIISPKFKTTINSNRVQFVYVRDLTASGDGCIYTTVQPDGVIDIVCVDTNWSGVIYRSNTTKKIDPNNWYQTKVKFTGTQYEFYYKENDDDWTSYGTVNGSTISLNASYLDIGQNVNSYFMDGSIDLKQFSITVDGKEVFNGLMSSTKPIYDKITTTNTTLSTFQTDTTNNFSAVNSALNEKANLSDLANYVPLATYNQLSDVAVKSSTVRNIVQISQTDYDALTTKDSNTLYIIV